jgi:predicted transcriptional regulator
MDGSSGKVHLSVRASIAMVEAFDRIAAALERDRTWVILRALRHYLDGEGAEILADASALAALDRGEGADFDAVMAEADRLVAAVKDRPVKKAG